MKFDLDINIYQSFLIPLEVEGVEVYNRFLSSIEWLASINNVSLELGNNIETKMQLIRINSLPLSLEKEWEEDKEYIIPDILFQTKVKVSFDKEYADVDISYKSLRKEVEKRYFDFLMVIDLCKVGCFHFGQAFIEVNGKFKKMQNINSFSIELYHYSIYTKWPTFYDLNFDSTWRWYLDHVNPNGIDSISSTALSRALNAFSYFYADIKDIHREINTLF